jgi:N-acylneuraminate cytidylyltransferase/CMP-N,N'-diacetyllegionaminic acid synthase
MPEPRVLATICARGGSKGLPGKNVRPLLGKPLLVYTIECALACPQVGQIVISTDSDEIASAAEACGVTVPFRRPPEYASDSAAKIDSIRHATLFVEEHYDFSPDIVVDLDVGVPLRVPEDIANCIDVLAKDPGLDGAITLSESDRNPYFNMVEFEDDRLRLVKQPTTPVVRRQDAPQVYNFTPAVFAVRRSSLMSVIHLHDGCWGGSIMPRDRSVDIDHELDFLLVEQLMKRQRESR